MGPDGIRVEVWESFREEWVHGYVVGSVTEDFRAGENARGMDPRDSVIVPISEDKRDIKDCWHYRGQASRLYISIIPWRFGKE